MKSFCLYACWLWTASKGTRANLFLCGLLRLLHTGVSFYFIYVCKTLVDIASGVSTLDFRRYTWQLAGCVVLQLILSNGRSYLSARNDVRLQNYLRGRIFSRLAGMDYESRLRYHSGDIQSRLTEDVRVVANMLGQSLPSFAATLMQLVMALVFLSSLDIRLAWLLITVLPACLLLGKLPARNVRRLTLAIRQGDSRVQSFLQECFQHLFLLQAFEKRSWMERQMGGIQDGLYSKVMRRNRFSTASRVMVQLAFSGGYSIAFLWGVHGIYTGTVTFGMMTAFLQLVGQIQRPLMEMGRQLPSFIHTTTSIDRLKELETDSIETVPASFSLSGKLGIRFRNVSFHYPGASRYILRWFSHDFRPGSSTAILGETGAGKTTIFRLILSLLRPTEGHILLYNGTGQEMELSSATLCNLIYVPQGNSLWSGTIRENLLLGNPEATEPELCEVLEVAAAEFVFGLEEGLDTSCGEQGGGLSEGQAQRIAIARALLRKGSVYLFDELSSSLDDETESRLIRNLSVYLQGHTLLFITHRHRIAAYCDCMVTVRRTTEPVNTGNGLEYVEKREHP